MRNEIIDDYNETEAITSVPKLNAILKLNAEKK